MQTLRKQFFIYLVTLVMFGLGLARCGFASDLLSDADALKTKVFALDPVHIDKIYAPTKGPISKKVFNLGDDDDGMYVWVREISLRITDPQGNALPPRYLCHSRAEFSGLESDMILTLSQGMLDLKLPEGYAAQIENKPEDLVLLAQTMNSDISAKQKLIYTFSIKYYSDKYARSRGIKPLRQLQLHVDAKDTISSSSDQQTKEDALACAGGGCMGGPMFYVPPGFHIYSSQVPPEQLSDFTIHFIKLHLHTYGKSLSLIDDTTHKTLWKGLGASDEDGTMLTNTDHYSNSEGIRIDPSHTYRLETVYDNPTNHLIDAMAIIRMYVADNK